MEAGQEDIHVLLAPSWGEQTILNICGATACRCAHGRRFSCHAAAALPDALDDARN